MRRTEGRYGVTLVDVFFDRTCDTSAIGALHALSPVQIDITDLRAFGRLAGGGVVLISPRVTAGGDSIAHVRAVRSAYPHVVIVLCVEWRDVRRSPISRWVKAGVDEIATVGERGDATELLRIVQRHALAPVPTEEILMLRSRRAPSWELDAVLFCMRNAHRVIEVPQLAHAFGCSIRTIRNRFCGAGFPSPQQVNTAGRVLQMVELAGLGIRSPQEVAYRLCFPDPTAMRKTKWRFRNAVMRQTEAPLGNLVAGFPRLLKFLSL